ncbi:hypothetical protein KVR01_007137 [Diaporthe batatas]|uniref:uncharacterized protein n=1 Tax=Diaporthe batatas TaxID=748121 RepID=UPI001D036295|nr:uncharacterized protein KVR01_007137 [Diaporthe batatas]KAG8162659.1 hypothetical protein KVR01_007137 [Diaporthe batatas]
MARDPLAAIKTVAAAITTRQSAALWRPTSASLEHAVMLSASALLWGGIGILVYTRRESGRWAPGGRYLRGITRSRTGGEVFGALAVPLALVCRAFLFRFSLWWAQCTAQGGLISFLPAAIVLAEWAWPRDHDQDHTPAASPDGVPASPPQGPWSHLTRITVKHGRTRQQFPIRHLGLALAWAVLADRLVAPAAHTSTTGLVCPAGTTRPAAGLAQLLVRAVDAGALFLAGRWRGGGRCHQVGKEPGPGPVPRVDGGHRLALDCFVAAVAMLSLLAATSPLLTSSLREMSAAPAVRSLVVKDQALDSLLAAGVILSGLYLLAHISPATLALVGAAALTATHPNLESTTGYGAPRPIPTQAVVLGALAVATQALLSQTTARLDTEASKLPPTDKPHHRRRLAACLGLLTLLLAATCARGALSQPRDAAHAIQAAQQASDDWVRRAGASQDAREAAAAYRGRYGRAPPPNFDRWVAFARARGSPVLDVFDQIEGDLAPFRALAPAELRARTGEVLAARGGLGIGAIRIRGGGGSEHTGRVELGPGSPPTHFWMLEAWRDMIGPFAADLPDMDLAFNLDDECRVAVPRDSLGRVLREEEVEEEGADIILGPDEQQQQKSLRGWFSKAASPPWDDKSFASPGHATPSYFTTKNPKHGIYDEFITPACPPGSAALRHRWPDATRAMPIARGGIITATPDLCARPDLARLSGFLASPGGGSGNSGPAITRRLVPVFSQARAAGGGFIDILVPSPWHFADKVGVEAGRDVAWANKSDVVFWRGSSSDGWAEGSKWPGFLRARLVNLAKGLPSSSSSSSSLSDAPAVDVAFSGSFTRCSPSACRSMASTFYGPSPLSSSSPDHPEGAPRTDFQEHWAHRHLVDADGTGFSGRFLAFLQSRSTAYRATVFRTWMDERVHPWRHFVPLDASLSGLWEVVRFASREFVVRKENGEEDGGYDDGEGVPLAHDIATHGHEWAARALRKEDMQIYMFRLLLEWGRLVDDRRDELGYVP